MTIATVERRLGRDLTQTEQVATAHTYVAWLQEDDHIEQMLDRPVRTLELFASEAVTR